MHYSQKLENYSASSTFRTNCEIKSPSRRRGNKKPKGFAGIVKYIQHNTYVPPDPSLKHPIQCPHFRHSMIAKVGFTQCLRSKLCGEENTFHDILWYFCLGDSVLEDACFVLFYLCSSTTDFQDWILFQPNVSSRVTHDPFKSPAFKLQRTSLSLSVVLQR